MVSKILIKRHVKLGKEQVAHGLLNTLRQHAMHKQGYISGETLVNHFDSRSITVISVWQNVEDWVQWQESDEREAIESQLEDLLEEPAKYEIYDSGRSS